jgi:nucleoside-diphosphate-sugar epimerase
MSLCNKTILITGAGGFIGSSIIDRLQQDRLESPSIEIHALGREYGKLAQLNRQDGFTFHECDLLDDASLQGIVASVNPHVVIHLASSPDAPESAGHARDSIANNILATVNLADAFAQSANPEGVVYGDSTKVYGSAAPPYHSGVRPIPNSAYAITKGAGWDFIRLQATLSGFAAVAIRPTLIYGVRQPRNIIRVLLDSIEAKETQFSVQGGAQTRAPLHIDDAIDAFLAAAYRLDRLDSQVINIGGAEELTVAEIAQQVVSCMESDMKIHCAEDMRETEILHSTVDLSEAEDLLGWRPRVSFSEGIPLCLENLMEESDVVSGGSSQ